MQGRERFRVCLRVYGLATLVTLFGESAGAGAANDAAPPSPLRRFALVVGVEAYTDRNLRKTIKNAHNDAKRIYASLLNAGFSPRLRLDLTSQGLIDELRAIASDSRAPSGPAIVVFYFAGHGFQLNSSNFLLLANARSNFIAEDGLSLGTVTRTLLANQELPAISPRLTLLFLDACRTLDPGGLRGASGAGFSPILNPRRTVLSFAADFGRPAYNAIPEESGNSPYATRLGPLFGATTPTRPSLDVALQAIQIDVHNDTGTKQLPVAVHGDVNPTFFRFTRLPTDSADDLKRWETARDSQRSECIDEYILNNPDSPHLGDALLWDRRRASPNGGSALTCPRP